MAGPSGAQLGLLIAKDFNVQITEEFEIKRRNMCGDTA